MDDDWIEAMLPGGKTRAELRRRAQDSGRTTDWQEGPKCPRCGAIQNVTVLKSGRRMWMCHACLKRFTLDIQVTHRYHPTKAEDR